jgi:hypothetical protein
VFTGLSSLVRKVRESVQQGTFDGEQTQSSQKVTAPPTSESVERKDPSTLYFVRCLADIVAEKVESVARGGKYDLYLIASWLYTVVITSVVFAFEYLALQKIGPAHFQSAEGAGFWAFLGFSLGSLTPARVSAITPNSHTAALLCYSEAGCAVLILVILVFTVLTAARETFKSGVEAFGAELRLTAEAVDNRVTQVYRMTLSELELFLLRNQGGLVNALRKARGLPQLPSPPASPPPDPRPGGDGGAAA